MTKKNITDNPFKKIIKWYSLVWLLFFVLCILLFYLTSCKSFFADDDGLHQQYVYFTYTGIWIRRLFSNIVVKHVFEMPMWDMSMGMGADPIITFAVGTDPLYWISALIPIRYAEYAFNVMIVVKLYLAGAAFAYYSHNKDSGIKATIAGAMVYCFSSITYVCFSQAGFLPLFYLFPLLMVGVDRLWSAKGYKLYVLILAACILFSSYFTFMMGLLVIVYCVARAFNERKNPKEIIRLIGRFVIFTALAGGIGIGPVLPTSINLGSLDRFDVEQKYTVFSLNGIGDLFRSFFSYVNRNGIYWGVSSAVLIALILLFSRKKQNTFIKVLFILYSAAFLFPIVGSVFNGLNFSSERYIFGYILLLSYIVTLMFDELSEFKGRKWYISLIVGVVYLAVTVLSGDVLSILSGVSVIICLLFTGIVNGISNLERTKAENCYISVILITCFILSYAGIGKCITSYSVPFGHAHELMTTSTGDTLLDEVDLSRSRFDRIPYSYPEVRVNSSMLTGRSGYDFYHSNYNSYIHQFYYDIGSFSNDVNTYRGFRGSLYPEMICGTDYIVRDVQQERCIRAPYSYSPIADNGNYALYESDNDASLVYYYDDSVSYDSFDALSVIEKEESMMRYCVLENGSTSPASLSEGYNVISYEISDAHDLQFDGNNITVPDGGGYIELSFDKIIDAEADLYIDGFTGITAYGDMYYQVALAGLKGDEITVADFWVGTSETYRYYQGPGDLLFDFGYDEDEIDGIRIYINTPGTYHIDDLAVYSRTGEQLENTVDEFYSHADIEDVSYEVEGNHISIDARSDSERYLYIAVPYSSGWTATVDGEKAEILRANRAFMCIPVAAGDHEIDLRYCTPYLKMGMLISITGIAAFVSFTIISKKRAETVG